MQTAWLSEAILLEVSSPLLAAPPHPFCVRCPVAVSIPALHSMLMACRATFDTDNIDIGPERRAYLDHRLSRVWEVNSQVCSFDQHYCYESNHVAQLVAM